MVSCINICNSKVIVIDNDYFLNKRFSTIKIIVAVHFNPRTKNEHCLCVPVCATVAS